MYINGRLWDFAFEDAHFSMTCIPSAAKAAFLTMRFRHG
jgi:hypothetical protein